MTSVIFFFFFSSIESKFQYPFIHSNVISLVQLHIIFHAIQYFKSKNKVSLLGIKSIFYKINGNFIIVMRSVYIYIKRVCNFGTVSRIPHLSWYRFVDARFWYSHFGICIEEVSSTSSSRGKTIVE